VIFDDIDEIEKLMGEKIPAGAKKKLQGVLDLQGFILKKGKECGWSMEDIRDTLKLLLDTLEIHLGKKTAEEVVTEMASPNKDWVN
jgi:hypothetical protein